MFLFSRIWSISPESFSSLFQSPCQSETSYDITWLFNFRVLFNWVSKVLRDCIGFALLCSVIGLEISRHFLNQSDAKLKPIAPWSLAFSRAWRRLLVFGFGFTTLRRRKALYHYVCQILSLCGFKSAPTTGASLNLCQFMQIGLRRSLLP